MSIYILRSCAVVTSNCSHPNNSFSLFVFWKNNHKFWLLKECIASHFIVMSYSLSNHLGKVDKNLVIDKIYVPWKFLFLNKISYHGGRKFVKPGKSTLTLSCTINTNVNSYQTHNFWYLAFFGHELFIIIFWGRKSSPSREMEVLGLMFCLTIEQFEIWSSLAFFMSEDNKGMIKWCNKNICFLTKEKYIKNIINNKLWTLFVFWDNILRILPDICFWSGTNWISWMFPPVTSNDELRPSFNNYRVFETPLLEIYVVKQKIIWI